MKKILKRLLLLPLLFGAVALSGCDGDDPDSDSGSSSGGKSNVKVEVTSINIGSKDKAGRYSVKIGVKATKLGSGESVKTIGARWGTVRNVYKYQNSKSSVKSASLSAVWHVKTTYYVQPFVRTTKSGKEVTGTVKSKRTP